MRDTVAPYGELRVLQLSGGIEVAYCTKVLADAGADVAFVEPSNGHPLRSRAPLFAYLHSGKRSIRDDAQSLEQLLAKTDVVVADALPMPWDELHREYPHLTVAVITPYGLTGPWAGRAASDLTLQAAAGGMAPRGAIGKAPLMVGGEPSYWFAGAVAAASVLGVLPRHATGGGELIDISILEATHLEHGMNPVTFASMAQRPFQTSRGTPVPGIEPTSDGYVGFFVITGQQWLDFCALIGQPQWTEDERLFIATERRLRADELLGPIREWTRSQTTEEIVEIASLMRIPVAPIGNGATLANIDQFVAEEWFVQNPDGFTQPRRPYRFENERIPLPSKTDAVGAGTVQHWTVKAKPASVDSALPLAGIRVADFTGFWAGPLAGGILAGLGADVIHIEGPKKPDGIRMNTIRPMTEDGWWEWSPLFCGTNTNKRDLTVDLSTPDGREIALRLLATSDVMIENFSPRVVDQLGLGPDIVRAKNSRIIVVRMPAFGLSGPWRDRVGFAQTIEQAAGLAFVTGYTGEAPVIPNGMCDPLAGVFGAIAALVALAERTRTGAGQVVESAMIGAALNTAAEQLIDYSATGRIHTSLGNGSSLLEQDVFRCLGDDQWVAISIPDDAAMSVVGDLTGAQSMPALAAWCAERSAEAVTDALWSHGIPVSPVFWAQQTIDNPQFVARGFFESVTHPICGTHPYISWPGRFSAGPALWNRSPSPTMGQHNAEILAELGFDRGQIEDFSSRQVISDGVLTQKHGW
ncbi:MAG: CoA transferase [Actinomycetia bacterium]|nr:CoA transferase [Actinomycetes bacterium]